jgi:hypothetical protein
MDFLTGDIVPLGLYIHSGKDWYCSSHLEAASYNSALIRL